MELEEGLGEVCGQAFAPFGGVRSLAVAAERVCAGQIGPCPIVRGAAAKRIVRHETLQPACVAVIGVLKLRFHYTKWNHLHIQNAPCKPPQ